MARKKKDQDQGEAIDRKSAAAGETGETKEPASPFEEGPLDDAAAIAQLIELNHHRQECEQRYDHAKDAAATAKKELDDASNQISLLIDRIDRQKNGADAAQPFLKNTDTEVH